MKRSAALVAGVVSVLVCGLALGSGGVRAGEKEEDGKRIERRIEIVRGGGGAFLGVGLEDTEDGTRGAKVRTVEPDSAAEKAG